MTNYIKFVTKMIKNAKDKVSILTILSSFRHIDAKRGSYHSKIQEFERSNDGHGQLQYYYTSIL